MARESWTITNVSDRTFSIGDLVKVPSLSPNQSENLLKYHTSDEIANSDSLKRLFDLGWINLTKKADGTTVVKTGSSATNAVTRAEADIVSNSIVLFATYGGNPCDNYQTYIVSEQAMQDLQTSVNIVYVEGDSGNYHLGGLFPISRTTYNCCQAVADIACFNPGSMFALSFYDFNLIGEVDFSTFISLQWLSSNNCFNLSHIIIANLPNLQGLDFNYSSLSSGALSGINFATLTGLTEIYLQGNLLSPSDLDFVISGVTASVVANPRGGSLYLNAQSGTTVPTSASTNNLNYLSNNGWSVFIGE